MSKLFLHLLNISITAGWIVLVVVLLRFVLKKAPKWTRVVLWGLVALRLILPVSIESVTSLVPSAETIRIESVARVTPSDPSSVPASAAGERIVVETGIPIMNSAVSPIAERTAEHTDTVATVKAVASWIWLAGVVGMLFYALISFLRLKHRVRASVLLEKGVYVCDEIKDPFILGLLFPKIYLPSGMDEATRAYVLSHERAHLKRFDHIWKPLGFLLLSVYWFNPLLWLAYILLCRDIELACDEKVVKELDDTGKAAYSEALVTASVSRRSIAACPLAFGETGVKSRVKSVLNYKKPAFWIILAAILCCIAVAVCFLTVPKKKENTYVGTWELSKLITEGQEFDAAFLTMFGMDKDTIVLDADGTGKWVTETNGEISEWTATYTVNGNELEIVFVLSETSGSSGYRITKAAAYDPKSDTLSLVNEYETYIYIRAGGEQPVPDASLTVEKLVGVWRTDGIKLSDDEPGMLSGTLIFRKDGSAGLNLSAGSGAMQEECTFTLNGNTIELTSRGQTAPVSYDPAHDTLSLPMMNIGILTFTRTDEPIPSAPVSPAPESAVTEWLDYYERSSEIPWGDAKEIAIDAFPTVRFRWTASSVDAIPMLNSTGRTYTLFSGMPVWNVFFADVTGDGKPELCATVSFGSGIVDEHIVVYDYANKQSYTLWDRGTFDYHLTLSGGALQVIKRPYNDSTAPVIDTGALMMHDGVLSCQWQSDGVFVTLNRELHESELYGEWLVEEETDNDGNVLYTRGLELWKEYHFKEDGSVTYNETVPISSDYDLAFGHPKDYPFEVHDDYVYIAGDDPSGAFRLGQYDRDTRTLTLMYNTDTGTVYAKLKRLSAAAQGLDEATLCTTWMLAELEAPDGSSGDARALGLERYLVFRYDGTVRMIDIKASSDRVVPYTVNGNTVQFDGHVLRYDSELKELIEINRSSDVFFYTPAPNAVLPEKAETQQTLDEILLGTYVCTGAEQNGQSIPIPTEYVGMTVDLGDTSGSELYRHVATVTVDGVEKNGYDWTVDTDDILVVWNPETGDMMRFEWFPKEYGAETLRTLVQDDSNGDYYLIYSFTFDN